MSEQRKAKPFSKVWLLAGTVALLSACQSPASKTVSPPIEVLHSGSQCGPVSAGMSVRWLADGGALRTAMAASPQREIVASSKNLALSSDEAGLLVYQGQQSSAGYGLALASDRLDVQGDVATVSLKVSKPEAGRMAASVMTSPCLLLRLPKGDYSRVRVVDTEGAVLREVSVSP